MDRIRILATSDMHGYVTPFSYANRKEVEGGLVKLATQVEALRDENTILVDNGDTIQGSPIGSLYATKQPVKPGEKYPVYCQGDTLFNFNVFLPIKLQVTSFISS